MKAQVETQVHPTCLQIASLGRASAMALGVPGVTNSEEPRVQARSGPWFFWMDHSLLHTQEVPSEIPPQEAIVHWGRHCPGGDQHCALEGRKLGLDSCQAFRQRTPRSLRQTRVRGRCDFDEGFPVTNTKWKIL